MHFNRVCAVVVYNICRDSLAEVGFKAVNAHFTQSAKLLLIPLAGFGIGEVDNSHSRLPHIALEHRAVFIENKVVVCNALVEQL